MEQVAIITEEQKDLLIGVEYEPSSYFNPVQQCDGSWIITIQEIEQTTNPDYLWVKQLTLSEWCGEYIPVSGTTDNLY